MTQADIIGSQSALLASIATNADAAREMIAASNLPGATAVLEQVAANARDVAMALLKGHGEAAAVKVVESEPVIGRGTFDEPLKPGDVARAKLREAREHYVRGELQRPLGILLELAEAGVTP